MQLMEPECLYNGRGMTEWELVHYRLRSDSAAGKDSNSPEWGVSAIKLEDTFAAWRKVSYQPRPHSLL